MKQVSGWIDTVQDGVRKWVQTTFYLRTRRRKSRKGEIKIDG